MPVTITRSLLVVIIPGLLALAPWALWFSSKLPGFPEIYKTYAVLINASLLGFGVILGAVIEGAASHLEVRWDKEREIEFKVQKNWFDYLALQPSSEPVGFGYISRMVTTFYFELSMMVASPIALVAGATLIFDHVESLWSRAGIIVLILAAFLIWFFYWQAKCSHKVLCVARKELNERIRKGR